MILNYEYTITDTDKYNAIPIINNFKQVVDVVNGSLDNDNFANTADFEIERVDVSGELVAEKFEFGKEQEIPDNKYFQFLDGEDNIIKITTRGVEIG